LAHRRLLKLCERSSAYPIIPNLYKSIQQKYWNLDYSSRLLIELLTAEGGFDISVYHEKGKEKSKEL
jgi:hypothetical protein